MPVKVAFFLLNLGAGGVERVISTLLPEFSKQGLNYIIICLNSSKSFYTIPAGCKLFSLRDIFKTRFPLLPSYLFYFLAPFLLNELLFREYIASVQSFLPIPNLMNIIASRFSNRKRRICLSVRASPKDLMKKSKWQLRLIYYIIIKYLWFL